MGLKDVEDSVYEQQKINWKEKAIQNKKYATDISTDLHQSKIYSQTVNKVDGTEFIGKWNTYHVPFLFSTNGRNYLEQIKTKSGIWFLDIRNDRNRPDALRGWFSPEGLVDLYNRNIEEANAKLMDYDYDYLQSKSGLGLRYYQIDAIKAVENKIINNPEDKRALLVMATGTGKTRTVIGLVYRLIQSNRFKRVFSSFLSSSVVSSSSSSKNHSSHSSSSYSKLW